MRSNQKNFIAHLQASGKTAEQLVDVLAVGMEDVQECQEWHLTATEWRQCIATAAKHRIASQRPAAPFSFEEVLP